VKRIYSLGLVCLLLAPAAAAQTPQPPSQFLGIPVGADRTLADYGQIARYFHYLAQNSARMQLENLGPTTDGHEFLLAAFSSPENLKNAARYRDIARQLAHPRGLTAAQIEGLVAQGKPIVLITCNIHSTEIASSQMALELAWSLATAADAATQARERDMIILLAPSLNPDGEVLVTDWYRKYLGTRYEGGSMPWIYNHYTGHDDNRDWYMLTQKETLAMTRAVYAEWYPQVWLDEHQMGTSGPRLFVPPYADPIAPSVSPLMWRGINRIGANMAWRLEQRGKAGVVDHYEFDAYYPGSVDSNPEFKNMFALIIEAASAAIATPLHLNPTDLRGGGKGLPDYTVASNFPHPWPGGTWSLRDIMDYERIATDAMLETVDLHPADFLGGVAAMAREQIAAGDPNVYWRIPRAQRDPVAAARLAQVMAENAVRVLATPHEYLIPTAQAYGKYAQELLGIQHYPEVRAAAGDDILQPYDVTAWSLPLMMGVEIAKGAAPEAAGAHAFTAADFPAGGLTGAGAVYALGRDSNAAFKLVNAAQKAGLAVSTTPDGTLLLPAAPGLDALARAAHVTLQAQAAMPGGAVALKRVRVGLYKPWTANMDEGWTRFVLDQYGFAPRSLDNAAVQAGNLRQSLDAIIIPDMSAGQLRNGQAAAQMPAPYAGGIGAQGEAALRAFVAAGGTLITLGRASEWAMESFRLPVSNALARVQPDQFSAPGSLLRVQLDTAAPVNFGMPREAAIFVDEPLAFATRPAPPEQKTTVLAEYPARADEILLSGWMRGADLLTRRAAAVSLSQGAGRLVLFGFRVQNRAQTEGTFKMLFNAILTAGAEGEK
jgi:hypothetical protein